MDLTSINVYLLSRVGWNTFKPHGIVKRFIENGISSMWVGLLCVVPLSIVLVHSFLRKCAKIYCLKSVVTISKYM